MKGFILGFHRLVWCPKWTPESNNSLMPILITIFLWLKARSLEAIGRFAKPNHPAEHGIDFSVIVATCANAVQDI
jgi:hypothetical protein